MGPKGRRLKSWSRPATTTLDAAIGELERVLDDRLLEELHLVDPDDLEALGALQDVVRARDRDRAHPRSGMADDVGRVVPVVDVRLEDHDALASDLRPSADAGSSPRSCR